MVTTFLIKDAPIERINFWLNRNAVKLKYGDNYRNFNFKQCLAVSTEEINGKLVGVSSVMNRDIWPSNYYRILNRHFILPEYRTGYYRNKVAERTIKIIKQQCMVARHHGAECMFVSIHSYRPRWTKFFAKLLNETTSYKWSHEDLVLVTNNPKTKQNYQPVIYTGDDNNFFNKRKIRWNTYMTLS